MGGEEHEGRGSERRSGPARRVWLGSLAAIAVVLVVALAEFASMPAPAASERTVTAPAAAVILARSDIPEVGWGLRASGANGTGVWRLFSVHNELILAFLNVTLWVESSRSAAAGKFASIVAAVGHPVVDGGVGAADASFYWSYGSGTYAGIVVLRYNVVFVLDAVLESSFILTRSDLDYWGGWQLAKIESLAA